MQGETQAGAIRHQHRPVADIQALAEQRLHPFELLEHSLGVALFTRSTRSVALTAAGRAFFIEAQALLEHAQSAALSAKRVAQGDSGSVTISFVPSAVYEFLPRVIAQAQQGFASVAPNYVQFLGSTLTILALVNTGMGVALVPRSARVVHFENILFRPITLAAGIQSELHLVWRDDNDNPAFLLMLEAIRQSVANNPG